MNQLNGHLLGFTACGPVPDGDVLDTVPAYKSGELFNGFLFLTLTVRGIDNGSVKDAPGSIHNGNLAPHTVSGIQTHRYFTLDRRLHQQRAQVESELADGPLTGLVCQIRTDLPFQ